MATPTSLPSTFVAGNVLTAAEMNSLRGGFRILQVAQAIKTDTFTTASTSFVDITDLSVSITPSETSNKVLLIAQLNVALDSTANAGAIFQLAGGNTASYTPATVGARTSGHFGIRSRLSVYEAGYWSQLGGSIVYLDSPSTTSSTTYTVQMVVPTGTGYVNRTGEDASASVITRLSSSLTALEVSA